MRAPQNAHARRFMHRHLQRSTHLLAADEICRQWGCLFAPLVRSNRIVVHVVWLLVVFAWPHVESSRQRGARTRESESAAPCTGGRAHGVSAWISGGPAGVFAGRRAAPSRARSRPPSSAPTAPPRTEQTAEQPTGLMKKGASCIAHAIG